MTKEQQRIAIAVALGYIRQGSDSLWFDTPDNEQIYIEDLPDWPNDRNAMHEALSVLNDDQQERFTQMLANQFWNLCGSRKSICLTYRGLYQIVNATAAQRAEAFLETLNLWKP